MEEEIKKEIKNEEPKNEVNKEPDKPTKDTGEGSKLKPNTLVDDTNLAAKRMEDATAAAKEERIAREESYSKMKLSGETEGGITPQEPKEETPKEYKDRLMSVN